MRRGVYTALITPFKNEKIDFFAFEKIIKKQLESNIDGILIGGTTGESVNLTLNELESLVIKAREVAGNSMEIMLGIGKNSTQATIKMAENTKDWNIDSYLVVTPYYNKPTQDGLIKHFSSIADKCSKPLVLYNVPGRTACNIKAETTLSLSKHPNIKAIKEASGDIEQVTKILIERPEDFYVYSGDDALSYPLLSLGIDGVISVVANVIPEEFEDLVKKCLNGNFKQALKLQYKYFKLMRAMFIETNPIPVKESLALMGVCEPDFRLPLCNASGNTKKTLENILKGYELI